MAEQRNIFLIGPMGAGKSTIGRHLAQMLHLNFHDSDGEIEKKTGADIAWIFDVEGEEGFRNRESDMIDELSQKHGMVLATGGGAVGTGDGIGVPGIQLLKSSRSFEIAVSCLWWMVAGASLMAHERTLSVWKILSPSVTEGWVR